MLSALCAFFVLSATTAKCEDTLYIKVHFLYGSKPKKEHKSTEGRWFGGIHGGHVGVEVDTNLIIDFVPSGTFHIMAHKKSPHSRFATNTPSSFYQTFSGDSNSVKRMTVIIPITGKQKKTLDSLYDAYTSATPYDYAFLGMRCAAAAYDVLAQAGVLRKKSRIGNSLSIFYPKILRKRLVKLAEKRGWEVIRHEGSDTRKWESD